MNLFNKYLEEEKGKIIGIQDNIILASGLNHAYLGEVVNFKTPGSDIMGQVLNLEKNLVRLVIIKGRQTEIEAGDVIHRSYKQIKTRVGFGVLGKLMNPLGDILNMEEVDENYLQYVDLTTTEYHDIERPAPGIIEREPVRHPFLTGTNVVDCFIPVGCGQRELIIGDHNTGKTSLAITAILNQRRVNNKFNHIWRMLEDYSDKFYGEAMIWRHSNFIPCIYVAIGQRRSEVARIKKLFENANCLYYTSIVFTSADEPASVQFTAPYAGCTMGEWFRNNGYKAAIVYDDLSSHAVAYRQMSLLLRRPPGREAYPGDVFYVHSKLLERAAQLHRNLGGGALTALPIIETRGGDISAYIPTNVISITDGQIFLSKNLANKGTRPAVNIALSVSRVGSNAQTNLMKELTRKLKANYALYNIYKGIENVGGELDPFLMRHIIRGKRIDAFFKQSLYQPMSYIKQVVGVFCLINGLIDNIEVKNVEVFFYFLFSHEFSERYLNSKLYHFATDTNDIESWLYSNTLSKFPLFEKDLHEWCKSSSEFFIEEIQPRLARDKYNILFNVFKSSNKDK